MDGAAKDLVSLIEGAWFGQPVLDDSFEPSLPCHQPRQGSADSVGDPAVGDPSADGLTGSGSRRRTTSSRRSAPLAHQATTNRHLVSIQQEDDEGMLGTWAGRQKFFTDHLRQQEEQQQQEQRQHGAVRQASAASSLPPAAVAGDKQVRLPEVEVRGTTPPFVPAPVPRQQRGQLGETSLDQEMNAAWRWRFTRKWQAEQMKQFEPPPPPGANGGLEEPDDEEEWTAALRLMDTVDGGLNLQIGRTLSLQNSSMVEDNSVGQSLTLMSPGLGNCMLLEGSIKESPLREEASAATSQIVSVARKAQHLRRQQQEIERQVNERWEAASVGSQWVAQHLPAVQIDSWSAFPFVLVRLSEQRSQRQKLLVRGRNGSTEQQAFASTEQEAARVAVAHRLPGPRVELVATGRMEWVAAASQRRTLRVRAGRLLPPAAKDTRLRSTAGVSAVVAELARASFPAGDFDIVAADSQGTSSRGGPASSRTAGSKEAQAAVLLPPPR